MNRPFTKDLYSDSCLHHNIEGESYSCTQKNWDLDVRLKLPHTMLHRVKQGLTTVVVLQLFTSCLNRENSVSRFMKTKMHHVKTYTGE